MKIIYNNVIPFKGFRAMNLFGVMFARKSAYPISEKTINHESIHTAQMKEHGYIFFYIIYFVEWLYRLIRYVYTGEDAYRNISFEREAYAHDGDMKYLENRKVFAQWRPKLTNL